MSTQYNFDAARSRTQIKNMQELAEAGICFMCYDNLVSYERNQIEFETKHWIITPNAYPYEHTALHLLLIARRHVVTLSDLTTEERADLIAAIVDIEKRYALDSYAVGMRNGDFHYNGGSVEHLHAHVVVGERNPKTFDKVRFKMSSLPDMEPTS